MNDFSGKETNYSRKQILKSLFYHPFAPKSHLALVSCKIEETRRNVRASRIQKGNCI